MNSHQLCTALPDFYSSWAWELEQAANFKKAEEVFSMGLQKVDGEKAREMLQRKRDFFQARAVKELVAKRSEMSEAEEEERSALASLRGHGKKHVVGSVRVGAAKIADEPGKLSLPSQNPNATKPVFAIYQVSDVHTEVYSTCKDLTSSFSLFRMKTKVPRYLRFLPRLLALWMARTSPFHIIEIGRTRSLQANGRALLWAKAGRGLESFPRISDLLSPSTRTRSRLVHLPLLTELQSC